MHAGEGGVIGSEAAVVQRKGVHAFFRHILLGEHGGEFAGAVVAEVVEDDGISFLDGGNGLAALGNHDGLDELVGDIGIVAGLDAFLGAFKGVALAFDQEIVGLFHAVPALVAVHGIEAAADGCHLAGGFGHLLFQLLNEAQTTAGVRVAAVHEGVDIDFVQTFLFGHAQEFVHMIQGAVNAAVGGEAHQVQLLAAGLHIFVGGLDLLILEELVLTAGDVDLHQVLVHHAACTQVHVAHFGVTHLAIGKADVFAAGLQVAVGIFLPQRVDIGRALGPDGVGIVVAAFTPAVQNHKKYFAVHIVCYLFLKSTNLIIFHGYANNPPGDGRNAHAVVDAIGNYCQNMVRIFGRFQQWHEGLFVGRNVVVREPVLHLFAARCAQGTDPIACFPMAFHHCLGGIGIQNECSLGLFHRLRSVPGFYREGGGGIRLQTLRSLRSLRPSHCLPIRLTSELVSRIVSQRAPPSHGVPGLFFPCPGSGSGQRRG